MVDRQATSRLILGATIVGVVVQCRPGPEAEGPAADALEITVDELWATQGDDRLGFFGFIAGAAVVGGDRIWVSDAQEPAIQEYDFMGVPVRTIAREGDGPGEVRGPFLMTTTPSGRVVAYDVGHSSFEVFEPSGDFLQRIKLGAFFLNPKGLAATDERLYIAAGAPVSGQALHELDWDGDVLRQWYPLPTPSPPVDRRAMTDAAHVASGPIDALPDGSLLFSQSAPHRIMRFAPGDTVGTVITADPDILRSVVDSFSIDTVVNGRLVTWMRWLFPQSRGVFGLSDGRILNIITLQDESSTIWQLYASDGSLTATAKIPRAYWPWDVVGDEDAIVSYRDPDTDEWILARLRFAVKER
jgi:hypothetical protein